MSETISDQELIEALGRLLDGREISGVRRRPYRYATSAHLEEVTVLADGEEVGPLILKDLSRDRLIGDARAAKPEFVYEPRREAETYRAILAPGGIGPRCLAAVVDRGGARCWLLLEKVPGVELWQVGELEVWQQVAHWLAGFHVRFAGMGPELLAASPHLLEHTADSFRAWGARARGALDASSDRRSDALASALERYGEIADALAAIPPTLVHGELYPSNVLVVRDERPLGVYPVDWEMAAVGPAPLDVAALVGGWSRHERELLALAYLDGLGRAECSGEEREQFLADLSRCRLQLAVQWLGWASDWVPPKEHAHDWLGEALALSEELGLA